MNRSVATLIAAIEMAGLCWSQEILTPIAKTDSRPTLNPTGRPMRVVSQSEDRLIALLLSPGPGPAMFADARLIAVDKAGVPPRDLGLSNYTGQVVGGGGDWVFIAGAPASRLLNVRTGQFRDLPVTGGVFGAVAMGDTLALLQAAGGGSVMSSAVSVYDCNTGSLLGSTSHEAFPAFVFLSFAAPDTLLFVEVSTLRVTPIQIHDGHVTAGASYVLSGDEADRSLRDVQNRPSSPALRRSLVIAHVPGHNGNQLFFLEPHEHAEGFRLAEFDSQGRQLRSFRLRGEDDEATKTLSRGPLKISVTDQTFTLPDRDGVLRTFRRP